MFTSRSGHTLSELVVTVGIVGLVTALSIPRLHAASSSTAVRSARARTASYLMQARALGLQRGREARFVRSGDTIAVTVDSSGTQVIFARPHSLRSELGVAILSATHDTIAFDSRGYAVAASSIEAIRFSRDDVRDSVCITKLGKVIERGCAL